MSFKNVNTCKYNIYLKKKHFHLLNTMFMLISERHERWKKVSKYYKFHIVMKNDFKLRSWNKIIYNMNHADFLPVFTLYL